MVWVGTPYAHEIEFSTGLPTGAVLYSVLGNDGLPMAGYDDVSVTPDADALSLVVIVPGTANTVSTPYFESRTLTWSYTTANGLVFDQISYRVEKPVPFPATADGVRAKLGVQPKELPNANIDLQLAYAGFSAAFETGALDAYEGTGDYSNMLITNAIEAKAALMALPTLQLAAAKSENSGTNEYVRFSDIDWAMLEASLNDHINRATDLVVPPEDELAGITIFFAVSRPDPLTGAT